MERLGAVLREAGGEDLKALKDAVLEALRCHTGGRLDHDDVTFMAVEVL
jgi:serine phosphatase RsbU (regulator of sigma subunit)